MFNQLQGGLSSPPQPDRFWASDITTRQYTQNIVWETIVGTRVAFLAQKPIYEVLFTGNFRFDRGGFWQSEFHRLLVNLGTVTPTQWVTEYNEAARLPVLTRITRSIPFVLEVNVGDYVTVDVQRYNNGTSNYATYVQTFVSVK